MNKISRINLSEFNRCGVHCASRCFQPNSLIEVHLSHTDIQFMTI